MQLCTVEYISTYIALMYCDERHVVEFIVHRVELENGICKAVSRFSADLGSRTEPFVSPLL